MARAPDPPQNRLPPHFIVDNKKSEVNELKQLLKQTMTEKDQNKRREVIKKVIAYMTLGVDVSRLFTDMVMISSTTDIVQKKMIFLYLINYASDNAEQALMAINTFHKDCKRTNPDPKIRGLALRSLCSLRFQGVSEYIQPAVEEGLNDPDPYVRRTAIIGVIKLFHIAPALVTESSLVNMLYEMIRDNDTIVSCNSIMALNEILADEGGIAVNKRMVTYLMNRVNLYTDLSQSVIFDLVSKYNPDNDEEIFDIMNILDDRLRQSSSAVVLGCIKIFMNFTKDKPQIMAQVFQRVQAPLMTLFLSGGVSGTQELSYTVLCHIHLLITKGSHSAYENEYKHFFCKFDEPNYIKLLKIEILTLISTENNLQDIINELTEYVGDVHSDLARKAIRSIGKIAIRIPNASSAIIYQLLNFLKMNHNYILTETLIVIKDLLRKYRGQSQEILRAIESSLESVHDDEGKAAVIWMIGEFGEQIEDAPYILEYYINNFDENNTPLVSQALLTASVKLFLKRAPEMQNSLAQIMQHIFNHTGNPDLIDRAGFYYKLLRANPETAHEIVNAEKHAIGSFIEDEKQTYSDQIVSEFNTLSIIYRKPQHKFVKISQSMLKNPDEDEKHVEVAADTNLLILEESEDQQSAPTPTSATQPENLLEVGEYSIPRHNFEPIPQELFTLQPNPTMEAAEFQEMWQQLDDEQVTIQHASHPNDFNLFPVTLTNRGPASFLQYFLHRIRTTRIYYEIIFLRARQYNSPGLPGINGN